MNFLTRKFRDLPNHKMDATSEFGGHLDRDDDPTQSNWCTEDKATLVTSLCEPVWENVGPPGFPHNEWVERHLPVIDLDVESFLVPSSTPGHSHLYINKSVSREGLFEILDVLAKHGIVEPGYASASKRRGFSAVRHPRVKKNDKPARSYR
jgi:hypothetical protein